MRPFARVLAMAGLALAVGCAQKADQPQAKSGGESSEPSDDTVAPMPREVVANANTQTQTKMPPKVDVTTRVEPEPDLKVEPEPGLELPEVKIAPAPRVKGAPAPAVKPIEPEVKPDAIVEVAPAPRPRMK